MAQIGAAWYGKTCLEQLILAIAALHFPLRPTLAGGTAWLTGKPAIHGCNLHNCAMSLKNALAIAIPAAANSREDNPSYGLCGFR